MNTIYAELGKRICDLRKSKYKDMSREEFAAFAGVDRKTMYNLEYGAHAFRMDKLLKVLSALNVSLSEFFAGFDEVVKMERGEYEHKAPRKRRV